MLAFSKTHVQDCYDVIIIGAGPGGSRAAQQPLREGLQVLQLEKHQFPRIKPCAGGLTLKSCTALNLNLDPQLRREFTSFEFNVWNRRLNRFIHDNPILKMVVRPQFDNWLVDQNRRYPNLTFRDQEPVREIQYDGFFRVRTDQHVFRGKQLVGADGAYSLVNRTFSLARPRARATAVEVNLYHSVASARRPLLPCFDFGAVDRGYGWVFPKDDHWSVGLYTLARGLKDLRGQLVSYIAKKGLRVENDPLATFEAYQIPLGGYRLKLPVVPVYVVGDAGGFADAVTGEGIYHALESGRLAGQSVCEVHRQEQSFRSYYRRLWKTVLSDTLLTYGLARVVYGRTRLAFQVLEMPLVWRACVQGYSEGAFLSKCLAAGAFYFGRSLGKARLESSHWADE